ncbi:hypothetical protein LLH00_19265 [bacterium]|nr:hypothetical protein [bacterium]
MSDQILAQLKQVCRNYRSKQYYVSGLSGGYYVPKPEEQCWCLLTQGPVGPDDRFVRCGECKPGRSCFACQIPD